ncbi:MAG: hypothetical protein LAQ30_01655 [Acidobacteriia bacterium]|nr:hypothetical protein [Terriglobia bacterium]
MATVKLNLRKILRKRKKPAKTGATNPVRRSSPAAAPNPLPVNKFFRADVRLRRDKSGRPVVEIRRK